MRRSTTFLHLRRLMFVLLLSVVTLLPAQPGNAQSRPPAPTAEAPHLELTVEPAIVAVGERVTVRITYVNLGLPYTTLTWDPPALAAFDPPRTMPCKYGEDASGCREITLRVQAPGTLSIHASATGEIFDDTCACWRWSGGSDYGPAIIAVQGSRLFLPVVSVP
ncbi:MAG: hypothetical protein HGA45_22675 [Chloroflexales bacterium]|nr:hypothetical protein [Chloroflexales bacterium]